MVAAFGDKEVTLWSAKVRLLARWSAAADCLRRSGPSELTGAAARLAARADQAWAVLGPSE